MRDKKSDICKVSDTEINDLQTLAKQFQNHANYPRICSIINILCQIRQKQSQENGLNQEFYEKELSHLQFQLHTLLTENKRATTWFTKIIDCSKDAELKLRLYDFIQRALGTVIKLSECVKGDKKTFALQFPNQNIRNVFLEQSRINEFLRNKGTASIIIDGNCVFFPAFLADNQQLGVAFPTIEIKEKVIFMLNLGRANLVTTDSQEATLYINDRRIHDTASKFYIAVICPYFAEYFKIQYVSHLVAQGHRDQNSFFSPSKLPIELGLKIAADSSTSDAISGEEKMQIAICNFKRP